MTERIHVVAAVLVRADGRVLVNQRLAGTYMAGRWEFPGGKLERDEPVADGLARELDEELGIQPLDARPLIRLCHDYPERRVLLDCWRVESWRGTVEAREGHPLAWVVPDELTGWDMLEADRPVITALRLPPRLAITADAAPGALLAQVRHLLDRGHTMIQLRAPSLDEGTYATVARDAVAVCRERGARLLLNADPGLALALDADGVHLNVARTAVQTARPLPADRWVSASFHDAIELVRARAIGCDFGLLGPVHATASHRGAPTLGWQGFRELADCAGMPVYALGGLGERDLEAAWLNHAQGVAAIRGFSSAP